MWTKLPVSPPEDPNTVYHGEIFPEHLLHEETVYPAINIPVKETSTCRKLLKQHLLGPKRQNTFPDPNDPSRRILVLQADQSADSWLSPLHQAMDSEESVTACQFTIARSYQDMDVSEVLQKILPLQEIPSAFETAGHIAHLNLRDEQLPYQYWVGKVILDKNKRITSVVNKLGNIENEYRTFGMQVIAGNDKPGWSIATVKEEGCTFQLDFAQVYWNSRLSHEHKRIIHMLREKAAKSERPLVVADLMAGVGPFAVPLTSQPQTNITVHANDLNPSSFQYLEINAKKNKCRNLHCYNDDGRWLVHHLQREGIHVDHFLMNLPASAPECLDAFRGYQCPNQETMPTVHCHCFCPKTDVEFSEAIGRCENALGCAIEPGSIHVHIVRDVSPTKNMLCVSFVLPRAVAQVERLDISSRSASSSPEEPDPKRTKLT